MTQEKVLLVEKHDQVTLLTLNRPDKLNAFNDELTKELQKSLDEVASDPNARALVITGAGRGFCSGQDLQNRNFGSKETKSISLGESIRRRYNPIIIKIRRMEKPIIAAVNGVAAGAGASLAFACDFRIVADSVSFIQSFTKIGLVPDSGSTFFLPRLIGVTKAFELMLSADKLDATSAKDLGLVNKVVPANEVLKESLQLAATLSSGPTKAFGLTKRAINRALFPDLEELLDHEAELQEIAGQSEDFKEGVAAFIEKRPPVYRGR
jgi:2-(1,2-epoxy-1,2-dihydrophenyl)acetyl-CoA isomerase